jgi:hypothetical protein
MSGELIGVFAPTGGSKMKKSVWHNDFSVYLNGDSEWREEKLPMPLIERSIWNR